MTLALFINVLIIIIIIIIMAIIIIKQELISRLDSRTLRTVDVLGLLESVFNVQWKLTDSQISLPHGN